MGGGESGGSRGGSPRIQLAEMPPGGGSDYSGAGMREFPKIDVVRLHLAGRGVRYQSVSLFLPFLLCFFEGCFR